MNEGTNRGNCVGFDMQFLMNLRDVKVTDASTDVKNLLQLLVDISYREDNQGIVSALDCDSVQAATRVAVKHLLRQLHVMESSLKRVEDEVSNVVEAGVDTETRFGLVMKVFTNSAKSELKVLRNSTVKLKSKLAQVSCPCGRTTKRQVDLFSTHRTLRTLNDPFPVVRSIVV